MHSDLRFQPLKILFGNYLAKKFAETGWAQVLAACKDESHPLARYLEPMQYERLKAVVEFGRLHVEAAPGLADRLTCSADVVRFVRPRCAHLEERAVWLLSVVGDAEVGREVLVQLGGDPVAPPPVRVLLRHALIKGADAVYIADYRPVPEAYADAATLATFTALVELGEFAGVEIMDYLVFAESGVVCLRDHLPMRQGHVIDIQAA